VAEPIVGRAELAARRLIAVGTAIVALLVAVVAVLLLLRDDARGLPHWFLAIAAGVTVAFVALGMLAPWLGPRSLRACAGVVSVAYALLLAAFLPAQSVLTDIDRFPWMLSASAAAVAAALLAFGQAGAWSMLALAAGAGLGYRLLVGGLDLDGIVNDAQATLSGAVVCVICGQVLVSSRGLDRAAALVTAETARASGERGRLAARTRAAALVHDEVLATLNLAASDLPLPAERLAAQAAQASGMVISLVEDDPAVPRLVDALRAEAQRSGAPLVDRTAGELAVDPAAAQAILAAVRQALENSSRHAGPGARRRVEVEGDASRVVVEVVDDGIGFEPEAVGADRLGVRSSILARVREVPGGGASVESAPGRGTRVRLSWVPPAAETEPPAASPRSLRAGLLVIAIVFVAGQTLSAVAAALATGSWWAPMGALLVLLAAAEVLRLAPTPVASLPRTAVFLVLVVGVVTGGLLAVPFAFGTAWFTAAAAFLLVALALRERPGSALAGLAAIVAVVVGVGLGSGAGPATIALVAGRPIVLVLLAVALLVAVTRMERRTRELHRQSAETARRAAWDAASRAELAARATELDRRVVPLLARIAAGAELTDSERRACSVLEGELRDEYRAGGLVREPLATAVSRARARGVDVVLLDDATMPPDEPTLDAVAAWMAAAIESARSRVVGRLQPADRDAVATVTVDGATIGFHG